MNSALHQLSRVVRVSYSICQLTHPISWLFSPHLGSKSTTSRRMRSSSRRNPLAFVDISVLLAAKRFAMSSNVASELNSNEQYSRLLQSLVRKIKETPSFVSMS